MAKNKREQERAIIGEMIKSRREEMNRSIEEVAAFTGYGVRTIESIEVAKFDFDFSILLNLCEALEIKPYFVKKEHTAAVDNLAGLINLEKN